jgi:hypothetical protein
LSELGQSTVGGAGAVVITLLVVLLCEREILRVTRALPIRAGARALLLAIVPLLLVFVVIGAIRISDLAVKKP